MTSKYNFRKKLSQIKVVSISKAIMLVSFLVFFFLNIFNGWSQSTPLKEEIVLSKGTSKNGIQDARPLVTSDGRSIFFGRRNYAKNVGGKDDFQDVWQVSLDSSNRFSKVLALGKNINTINANGICSINPSGTEILLTNDYFGNKTAPIARSKKTNGNWGRPEPVFIEDYYNKSAYVDFYQSYPHKVLFVAAERRGGQGDQDIYVCLEGENGNWKSPVNLGLTLNSKAAEFAPYLSSDGRTLFFASSREGGLGGSDIYSSTRLDSGWTNWSIPKNLGSTVNTPGEENYFSMTGDMKTIFVESFSKKTLKRSIYKIKMPEVKALQSDLLVSSE